MGAPAFLSSRPRIPFQKAAIAGGLLRPLIASEIVSIEIVFLVSSNLFYAANARKLLAGWEFGPLPPRAVDWAFVVFLLSVASLFVLRR